MAKATVPIYDCPNQYSPECSSAIYETQGALSDKVRSSRENIQAEIARVVSVGEEIIARRQAIGINSPAVEEKLRSAFLASAQQLRPVRERLVCRGKKSLLGKCSVRAELAVDTTAVHFLERSL